MQNEKKNEKKHLAEDSPEEHRAGLLQRAAEHR
jgi:hypothetical protein